MLINNIESMQEPQDLTASLVPSVIGLHLLDFCPRRAWDVLKLLPDGIRLALSKNRKLDSGHGGISLGLGKLPNDMVKGGAEIMREIADKQTPVRRRGTPD